MGQEEVVGLEKQEPTQNASVCPCRSSSQESTVVGDVQLILEPVGVFIRELQGYHDFLPLWRAGRDSCL